MMYRLAEMAAPGRRFALPAVVVGTIGFVLGFVLLVGVGHQSFKSNLEVVLSRGPTVAIWVTLMAAQLAMWLMLAPLLIVRLYQYRPLGVGRWTEFALAFVGFLTLAYVFGLGHGALTGQLFTPVHHQFWKVAVLTVLGVLTFALAVLGMFEVGEAARLTSPGQRGFAEQARALIALDGDLQRMLTLAGLIIGGATLSTGVLEKALTELNPGSHMPSTLYALLYGAFGTGVLALFYAPAYAAVSAAGRQLCENHLPLPGTCDELQAWDEKRKLLECRLGLDRDTFDRLKTGLVILSPIIAGAGSFLSLK